MIFMVMQMDPRIEEQFKNAGYGVFNHSAVEICSWTKKAIKQGRFCYKNRFYGIETHRCMQISQAAAWCTSRCVYCWRPNEYFMPGADVLGNVDPPWTTMEKLRDLRRQLLSGFWGDPQADKELLREAVEPSHVTFSLSGEPLLYPYVPESIEYVREAWNVKSVFVVTAGLVPESVKRFEEMRIWPDQFYLSLTAPNEEIYRKVSRPLLLDYWERLHKTMRILRRAPVRRVARITLIRGLNDVRHSQWAELVERMDAHFIEVKAYMYLGRSRVRLTEYNMPEHEKIVMFSRGLLDHLPDYEFFDEDSSSRVTLIKKEGAEPRLI